MVITCSLIRCFHSALFAVAICAPLIATAHAADVEAQPPKPAAPKPAAPKPAAQPQRPASPLEAEAPHIAQQLAERDARLAAAAQLPEERSVWLSAGFTWHERTSLEPRVAAYQSGPGVELAASILLTPWLGARLSVANESHAVRIRSLSNTGEPTTASDVALWGLALGAALEPRWDLSERFSVLAGFGIAWDRFSLGEMTLQTSGGPALVRPRTGVMLEYPITFGLGFSLIPRRFAAVLRGRYAPRSNRSQTGDIFDGGAGAGQTVSQSTGEMLFVPGLPRFAPALSLGLHLELAL